MREWIGSITWCFAALLYSIQYLSKSTFNRVFRCPFKGHENLWAGGGWIFESKSPTRCKHCGARGK